MDITRLHVVAQVQPSPHLNGFAEPHMLIHHDGEEPTLTLENSNNLNYDRELLRSEYRVSRCVSNFDYHTEVEYLVNTALDGYDAAAIFMSASTTDTYRQRQEVIHGLLTDLDSRMETLNRLKERHGHSPIKIEFAYLGITDDGCYDMRTHQPLKNSQVLELGLAASMRSVKSANQVWDKIKSGSKFPSILGVRLSDESKLLGTLMIADLLQPWSQTDSSIRYSFKKLLEAVDKRMEDGFEGFIPIETSVLTKLLGPYFCGLGKSTIFIQIDEYPRESLDATLNALNLSHKLYNMRSIATRNEPETLKHSFKKLENEKKKLLEEKHALKKNIQELEKSVQELEESIQDLHKGYRQEELRVQKQNQEAMNLQLQRIEELNNQLRLALEREEEYKKTIDSHELQAAEMNFLASSGEYLSLKLQREIQEYKVETEKSDYTITMLRIRLADMKQELQDMQDNKEYISAEAQTETKEMMRLLNVDMSEAKVANKELEKDAEKLKKETEKLKKEVKKLKDEAKRRKVELKEQREELEKQKEELKHHEDEIKEQETFFLDREKALQADLDFVTEQAEKLIQENETLRMFVDKFEQKNDQLKKKVAEKNRSDRWGLSNQERKVYEDLIEEYKTRAQKAEKKLSVRKIHEDDENQDQAEESRQSTIPKRISAIRAEMIDFQDNLDDEATDIEEEHHIQHRVLPKRGVKKVQSYDLKGMFEHLNEQENDFQQEVLPKKKVGTPPNRKSRGRKKAEEKEEPVTADPPKRQRGRPPRKQKPEKRPAGEKQPSQALATPEEPRRDDDQGPSPKPVSKDVQSTVTDPPKRQRGRPPRKQKPEDQPSGKKQSSPALVTPEEPNSGDDQEPSPEPEGEDVQSPVMEYDVELKMPEDTPEEEEQQDVKQQEMAPPRKKRKLRDTKRAIDYDTEFLSPLSKVNNTLNKNNA